MDFNDVTDKIEITIDAAGVVVIVTGAAIAFAASAVRLSRHESDVYRRFRQRLSQAILLGLEPQVGDARSMAQSYPGPNLPAERKGRRMEFRH